MKKMIAILGLVLAASAHAADLNIIPQPSAINLAGDGGSLTVEAVSINVDSSGQMGRVAAAQLAGQLAQAGINVVTPGGRGNVTPVWFMGGPRIESDENYTITISARGFEITASSDSGYFYAAQTIRQLLPVRTADATTQRVEKAVLPFCTIRDTPRFRWRGAMLDLSRHFFDAAYLKHFIDLLALHKMNVLHLHLTDSSGWRIESAGYPRLNTIGATGNHSDSNAPPAFLSAGDITELVDYAKKQFITIVPEIDMPGHADAATRAYPELDGGSHTFNPGTNATYAFISTVLAETASLFPSPVIHFGGDEVAHKGWAQRDEVVALMEHEYFTGTKDVEAYFDRRAANIIAALGRRPGGWDEIAAAGVSNRAVIFWWRHDKPGVRDEALASGYDLVLCPRDPCYFDYRQLPDGIGAHGWKITNTLENVYVWEPTAGIPPGHDQQILGVQANLWTEHISDIETLERLTLPRLAALAEVAWTTPGQRNWLRFVERIRVHQPRLKALGYITEDVPLPEPRYPGTEPRTPGTSKEEKK